MVRGTHAIRPPRLPSNDLKANTARRAGVLADVVPADNAEEERNNAAALTELLLSIHSIDSFHLGGGEGSEGAVDLQVAGSQLVDESAGAEPAPAAEAEPEQEAETEPEPETESQEASALEGEGQPEPEGGAGDETTGDVSIQGVAVAVA